MHSTGWKLGGVKSSRFLTTTRAHTPTHTHTSGHKAHANAHPSGAHCSRRRSTTISEGLTALAVREDDPHLTVFVQNKRGSRADKKKKKWQRGPKNSLCCWGTWEVVGLEVTCLAWMYHRGVLFRSSARWWIVVSDSGIVWAVWKLAAKVWKLIVGATFSW